VREVTLPHFNPGTLNRFRKIATNLLEFAIEFLYKNYIKTTWFWFSQKKIFYLGGGGLHCMFGYKINTYELNPKFEFQSF